MDVEETIGTSGTRTLLPMLLTLVLSCDSDPGDSENLTPQLEDCLVGAAFAECGEGGAPTLGCDADDCLWFTGDMAAGYVESECTPEGWHGKISDSEQTCYCFMFVRGDEPWNRQRAMALDVDVDPAVEATTTRLTCTGCSDACDEGVNPCATLGDENVASVSLPGTLVIGLEPYSGVWPYGWFAEIEVDLDKSVARFCRFPVTDAMDCEPDPGSVDCAKSGTVLLSRAPASESELAELRGHLSAAFADGLIIDAEFVADRL